MQLPRGHSVCRGGVHPAIYTASRFMGINFVATAVRILCVGIPLHRPGACAVPKDFDGGGHDTTTT